MRRQREKLLATGCGSVTITVESTLQPRYNTHMEPSEMSVEISVVMDW